MRIVSCAVQRSARERDLGALRSLLMIVRLVYLLMIRLFGCGVPEVCVPCELQR